MISGIILAAIGVVKEILSIVNTEVSRKYLDRLVNLRLEIQAEEDKGYESDDAKIESLYKEIKVIFEAAQAEVALFNARAGK